MRMHEKELYYRMTMLGGGIKMLFIIRVYVKRLFESGIILNTLEKHDT